MHNHRPSSLPSRRMEEAQDRKERNGSTCMYVCMYVKRGALYSLLLLFESGFRFFVGGTMNEEEIEGTKGN